MGSNSNQGVVDCKDSDRESAVVGSKVRSLPVESWPLADREAWHAACEGGARLRRGGTASHLKPITRADHSRRYGYFLDYLNRQGRLDLAAGSGAHVTPENIRQFLEELTARVSSVTAYGTIYKVRRITQLIAPSHDLSWLAEIEKDLEAAMIPRSKKDRFVLTHVLLEAGLTLIAEAEAAEHQSASRRACNFRNGLMIALLALCPVRLKNFAALEIGRTLIKIKGSWWIVLPAAETKEKRPDERRIDSLLGNAIDRYLTIYRPILARGENTSQALWLSSNKGDAMSYSAVEKAITETTRKTIGTAISPHLFRTAAASTAAIHGSGNPNLGSAVLHHSSEQITNEHYNRATSISAAKALTEVLKAYRTSKR